MQLLQQQMQCCWSCHQAASDRATCTTLRLVHHFFLSFFHWHHTDAPMLPAAGDGKLGLLIAQVLACKRPGQVTLLGRHQSKMSLVQGLAARIVVTPEVVQQHSGKFDLAVEASGKQLAGQDHCSSMSDEHPCWHACMSWWKCCYAPATCAIQLYKHWLLAGQM